MPTELHFQRYCVSLHPQLGGHTTRGRCMGPSSSGPLVPFTSLFEIDHWLAVPDRYCFRFSFRFPARCGTQNYSMKLSCIHRRHRVMTMAIEQSPCWVCLFSNVASTFLPSTVLPYLGTRHGFDLSSHLRMYRPTVIVGLFIQQAIALFVLKTSAGFSLFHYIADLAYSFLTQAYVGAQFFFDAETIAKNWFFVNTVR